MTETSAMCRTAKMDPATKREWQAFFVGLIFGLMFGFAGAMLMVISMEAR